METLKKIEYITDESGKKISVILPFDQYQNILEDIKDLVSIAERKDEPDTTLDELKKSLKSDGII